MVVDFGSSLLDLRDASNMGMSRVGVDKRLVGGRAVGVLGLGEVDDRGSKSPGGGGWTQVVLGYVCVGVSDLSVGGVTELGQTFKSKNHLHLKNCFRQNSSGQLHTSRLIRRQAVRNLFSHLMLSKFYTLKCSDKLHKVPHN